MLDNPLCEVDVGLKLKLRAGIWCKGEDLW